MIQVAGLDLSLRSSGLALGTGPAIVISPDPVLKGGERLEAIKARVCEILDAESPVLVAIETAAFSRGGGRFATPKTLVELAELNGVVKAAIALRKIPLLGVSPGQVKKFATGSGASTVKKKEVKAGCVERWGCPARGWDDNQYDAFTLARIAEVYMSVKMTNTWPWLPFPGQREVMDKLFEKELT